MKTFRDFDDLDAKELCRAEQPEISAGVFKEVGKKGDGLDGRKAGFNIHIDNFL